MLQRLASVCDLVTGKHLLVVLLKLFSFCVKVQVNRVMLIQPQMNTISIMLGALNLVSEIHVLYSASQTLQFLRQGAGQPGHAHPAADEHH